MFSFNRAQPKIAEVQDSFSDAFRGSFTSLMQWPQLDAFWDTVQAKADALETDLHEGLDHIKAGFKKLFE